MFIIFLFYILLYYIICFILYYFFILYYILFFYIILFDIIYIYIFLCIVFAIDKSQEFYEWSFFWDDVFFLRPNKYEEKLSVSPCEPNDLGLIPWGIIPLAKCISDAFRLFKCLNGWWWRSIVYYQSPLEQDEMSFEHLPGITTHQCQPPTNHWIEWYHGKSRIRNLISTHPK